jgi:hypothetical protein
MARGRVTGCARIQRGLQAYLWILVPFGAVAVVLGASEISPLLSLALAGAIGLYVTVEVRRPKVVEKTVEEIKQEDDQAMSLAQALVEEEEREALAARSKKPTKEQKELEAKRRAFAEQYGKKGKQQQQQQAAQAAAPAQAVQAKATAPAQAAGDATKEGGASSSKSTGKKAQAPPPPRQGPGCPCPGPGPGPRRLPPVLLLLHQEGRQGAAAGRPPRR